MAPALSKAVGGKDNSSRAASLLMLIAVVLTTLQINDTSASVSPVVASASGRLTHSQPQPPQPPSHRCSAGADLAMKSTACLCP
jgi:hypothetical protein